MIKRAARVLAFAVARPDLVIRWFRGQSTIEIGVDEIIPYLPEAKVVVEAGALNGHDTALLARSWPAAQIHAFEPVPAAFAIVVARTAEFPNVRRYEMALAEQSGFRTMHVSSDESGDFRPDSSSLLKPTGHLREIPAVTFLKEIDVPAVSLDDWARDNEIEQVDLLWLDLQGMELAVLQASPRVVESTKVIMMEVSRTELYQGAPLYPAVIDWMKAQDFRVAIDRVSRLFGNMLFVK